MRAPFMEKHFHADVRAFGAFGMKLDLEMSNFGKVAVSKTAVSYFVNATEMLKHK
jgi:hypothetical protein